MNTEKKSVRAVLTCGGTGGHITPALAIADILRLHFDGIDILFVGGEGKMEKEMVTAAGFPLQTLPVIGLPRRPGIHMIRAVRQTSVSLQKAKELLKSYRPDIVIGTGGYACYPTLAAAARLGIPTAVHESNAIPGLSVRLLARQVDRVWLHFPSASVKLPKGTSVLTVGNPVRHAKGQKTRSSKSEGTLRILSFGGSLGAEPVNRAVLSLMRETAGKRNLQLIHATGRREYENFLAQLQASGLADSPHINVLPFIEDMPTKMATADLIICRAGAMTLSEVAAAGKPAVLIPSPYVTANHQYQNAKVFSDAGAACLLPESDLPSGRLTEVVLTLAGDPARRAAMGRAALRLATPHADRLIYEDICRLLQKKKYPH